ncbi:MAG: hypothetical protein ACOZIN_01635 [Myxococcota bacterium]
MLAALLTLMVAQAPQANVPRAEVSGLRRYAWIPAAAGAGLLATGGYFFYVKEQKAAALRRRGDSRLLVDQAVKAKDDGIAAEGTGIILSLFGCVALATGGALYFLGAPDAPLALTPALVPGGGGLVIEGKWR